MDFGRGVVYWGVNVLIVGVGRAGKTTLANMIKDKFPTMDLVHGDSLVMAHVRADGREEFFRTHGRELCEFESTAHMQRVLVEFFASMTRNSKHGVIFEGGQFGVEHLAGLSNVRVICLALGDASAEEIVAMCRRFDGAGAGIR